jgi:flagellin
MGLRIGTNIPAITAQRQLGEATNRASHSLRALATGSRIVDAGDDAAGFAVSETLRGQVASLKSAKMNADNAVGLIQVAEGGLTEQNNILVRLRELSVQSASDTVSDDERGFIDTEFQQLSQEFDRIAKTTTFGSTKLLTGLNKEFEFHTGIGSTPEDAISYKMDADTTGSSLGVSGLSVLDKSDALSSISQIDSAILKMAQVRAGFGAIQSRLQYASDNIDIQHEGIASAKSRISDADIAYETTEATTARVHQDFATAVLAQANQSSERALKLLF